MQGLFYCGIMSTEALYKIFIESKGVSTDTRTVDKGQLFFALKGPNFDGNQKASEAIEKGAAYSIVDDPSVAIDGKYILVDDVLTSLQDLARYHRSKISAPVLGITGSNGKTTTKELIREVLKTRYRVASTVGNFNNHIGLPLTLLNQAKDADIWILEMGSNAPGNIQELCDIGHPNLGLITNIGLAHIEQLKSQEGVYKEKTSLYDSVIGATGIIFINGEDQWLCKYEAEEKAILYSSDSIGSIKIEEKKTEGYNLALSIMDDLGEYSINSQLVGSYNMINIAAAVAVGQYFDVPLNEICKAISNYVPENMRSQVQHTERNSLVIDAYNANPSSMKESILTHNQKEGDNLVFILGDMLELGDNALSYHETILELLANDEVRIITVGPIFHACRKNEKSRFENVEALIESGVLQSLEKSQVLIKGSRGIKLEKVIPYL